MLSLQLIRENPDVVRKALRDRQAEGGRDDILRLDEQRRQLLVQVEALKAERNAAGKRIGATKDDAERQRLIDEMRSVSERIDGSEPRIQGGGGQLHRFRAGRP